MSIQPPGNVYQAAYVVSNLHDAVRHWAGLIGAGPFFLFENFHFIEPEYNGQATELAVSIALGFSGGLCIEIIEQHDNRPSIYSDWVATKGHGLHHVAILEPNFPKAFTAYQKKGAPCVFRASFGDGTRFAYLDTRDTLGCYLEIVEFSDFVRDALGTMREAHESWDGQDPLRPFGA
jgi:hypothetical protein